MTKLTELPFSTVQFYATAPYPCSYMDDRLARSQVATPAHLITTDVYADLMRSGFRRSGIFTYRPYCDGCMACIPVRVRVRGFCPNRSQSRAGKRHGTLSTRISNLVFVPEHYDLYALYQNTRHAGGGMDQDSREQYAQFLLKSKVTTKMVEFRDAAGCVRMVSIIDVIDDALSSVYTFYDPLDSRASFGTYNVIWQIAQARALGMDYLYLGYWIAQSPKMAYKTNFQPLEAYVNNNWIPFERIDTLK